MANVTAGPTSCPAGKWTWLNAGINFTPLPWLIVNTSGIPIGTVITVKCRIYLSNYPYYVERTATVAVTPPALTQTFTLSIISAYNFMNVQINPDVGCKASWSG